MKDNTLRTELLEIIYQAEVSGEPGLDTVDAILLAIKNRLPKEKDSYTIPLTETRIKLENIYNTALADVREALDIESES
jgi:hypothetical protein